MMQFHAVLMRILAAVSVKKICRGRFSNNIIRCAIICIACDAARKLILDALTVSRILALEQTELWWGYTWVPRTSIDLMSFEYYLVHGLFDSFL